MATTLKMVQRLQQAARLPAVYAARAYVDTVAFYPIQRASVMWRAVPQAMSTAS